MADNSRNVSVRIDGEEVKNTLKSLNAEMRSLRAESEKLEQGTAAYLSTVAKISQIQDELQKNRENVKAIGQAWKNMPDDVKSSVQAQQKELQKLKSEYQKLFKENKGQSNVQMRLLSEDIEKLENRISLTVSAFSNIENVENIATNSLKAYNDQLKQATADIEKLSMSSKEYWEKLEEIQTLNQKISEHREALKGTGNELDAINKELSHAKEGTAAYITAALKLAQVNDDAKKHKDTLKEIENIWDKMPDEVKASIQTQMNELKRLKSELDKIAKSKGLDNTQARLLQSEISQIENRIEATTAAFSRLDEVQKGSLQDLENQLEEVNKEMKRLTISSDDYLRKLDEMKKLELQIQEHKKHVGDIGKGWLANIPIIRGAIAAAAGLFAVDQVIDYGREVYKTGVELDNIARKSVPVLQEQLGFVNEAARKNAEDIGLAREQYVGATTDLAAFFQAQRMTREESAKFSVETLNLAGVLAQFRGGGPEMLKEALDAIKGGFADDSEELAKFNIAISENIVQSEMAAQGLDKQNTKVQQVGKAKIVLRMITEAAAAQNMAFAGSADGVVRSQARMDAKLQEIKNNLARIFLPIMSTAVTIISPLVDTLASVSKGLDEMANPMPSLIRAWDDQNAKVKDLTKNYEPLLKRHDDLIKKGKLNKTEQGELKNIIQKVGEVMPIAATETDKYGKALGINTTIAREFLQVEKDRLKFINENAIKAIESEIFQMEKYQEQLLEISNTGERLQLTDLDNMTSQGFKVTNEELKWTNENIGKLQTRINGARAELKRLSGLDLPNKPKPDKVDLSGQSEEEKKKAEDKEKELKSHLEKLKEAVKSHNADLKEEKLKDEQKEIEAIKEKYRKDIELAESIEKQKTKYSKQAHTYKLELERQMNDEIANVYTKALEKNNDEVEKFLNAENLIRLTAEQREEAQIFEKYTKQIEAAKRVEEDTQNASEEQRQKAHAQRLILEDTRDRELQYNRQKRRADEKQKEDEETEKFIKERAEKRKEATQKIDNELLKNIETVTKDLAGDLDIGVKFGETLEEYTLRINTMQALELSRLKEHFDKLLQLADEFGMKESQLKNKQEEHKKAIDEKYKKLQRQRQIDDNVKQLQAQASMFTTLGDLTSAFGELITNEGAEQSEFQKVMTLAQISFDTASAISSLMAASAKNPLNAATAGVAGEIQFLVGIAKIVSNVARAKKVIEGTPKVKQKYQGGPVIGEDDGKTYNPDFRGTATTGLVRKPTLFLTGEGNRPEYVIAGPELQNPIVAANFIPAIEALRQNRMNGNPEASINNNNQNSITNEVIYSMMLTMNKAIEAFEKGIILKFEHLDNLEKMQTKLKNARGY